MFEPPAPRYDWGQRVAAVVDLSNDGSFPEQPEAALLVAQGELGEVVRVGNFVPGNVPVYLVDFGASGVVGCREEEIALANDAGVQACGSQTP